MAKANRNQGSRPRRSRSFAVNGELLRACRIASGWTQVEAADKAGFTDRLVRKAESGGPLQIQSIAILAQLYSTAEHRLTPDDLLAEPISPATAVVFLSPTSLGITLVRRLFRELWNERKLEVIDELLAPACVLHA